MADGLNGRNLPNRNFICEEIDQLFQNKNLPNCTSHEKGKPFDNNGKLFDDNSNHPKVTSRAMDSKDTIFCSLPQCSTLCENHQGYECYNIQDIIEFISDMELSSSQHFPNSQHEKLSGFHSGNVEPTTSTLSSKRFPETRNSNNQGYKGTNCIDNQCSQSKHLMHGYSCSKSQSNHSNIQQHSERTFGNKFNSKQRQKLQCGGNRRCPRENLFTLSHALTSSSIKSRPDAAAIKANISNRYKCLNKVSKSTEKRYSTDVWPGPKKAKNLQNTCTTKRRDTFSTDKLYKCDFCDKTFSNPKTLKRHCVALSCDKPYTCDICKREIFQLCHLRMHLQKNVSIPGDTGSMKARTSCEPYVCDLCENKFVTYRQLERHKRRKHIYETKTKEYRCNTCGKTFSHRITYEKHTLTHSDFKPSSCHADRKVIPPVTTTVESKKGIENQFDDSFRFKCTLNATFTSNRPKTMREKEKRYVCGICKQTWKMPCELKRHMKTHTGEKPFECDICDKRFTSAISLKYHKGIHSGDKPFQCTFCKKDFLRKRTLKIHIGQHTGERPYKCSICGKRFVLQCTLKMHMFSHSSERPYQCDICGKKYKFPAAVRNHKKIHTFHNLKCDFCAKGGFRGGFRNQMSLKSHERKYHGNNELYTCWECKQTFPTSLDLNEHTMKHPDEKRVICG